MTARIPEMNGEKRTFTGYVPHNKRLINGYHRTSNRLVSAKTEVQRINGQNILSTYEKRTFAKHEELEFVA